MSYAPAITNEPNRFQYFLFNKNNISRSGLEFHVYLLDRPLQQNLVFATVDDMHRISRSNRHKFRMT